MDIIKSLMGGVYIALAFIVVYLFIKKILSIKRLILSILCIVLLAIMMSLGLDLYYNSIPYATYDEPVATAYIMHYDDNGNYVYHHNGEYYYEEFKATSGIPLDRKVDDDIVIVKEDDENNPRIETYRRYKIIFGFEDSSYFYIIHIPKGSLIED